MDFSDTVNTFLELYLAGYAADHMEELRSKLRTSQLRLPYGQQEDAHEFLQAFCDALPKEIQDKFNIDFESDKDCIFLQEDSLMNPSETQYPKHTTVIQKESQLFVENNREYQYNVPSSFLEEQVESMKGDFPGCQYKYTSKDFEDESSEDERQKMHKRNEFLDSGVRGMETLKKTKIDNINDFLIVCIKRYEQIGLRRIVRIEHLNFQFEELFTIKGKPYHLKAIVFHLGSTPDSGHYVARVKFKNGWYDFDDEIAYRSNENLFEMRGETPYMLLYSCAEIADYKPKGIHQIGNSCYANSVLQFMMPILMTNREVFSTTVASSTHDTVTSHEFDPKDYIKRSDCEAEKEKIINDLLEHYTLL